MGKTHALSGAMAFGVAAIPAAQLVHLTLPELLLGTVVTAGAAMLPDIDHRESHVARTLGPLSRGLACGVAWLAGGHRRGVHSLVGVAVVALLAFLGAALRAGSTSWAVAGVVLAVVLAGAGLLAGMAWPGDRRRGWRVYPKPWHGPAAGGVCAAAALALAVGAAEAPHATGTGVLAVLLVLTLASAARVFHIRHWTRLRAEVDDWLPIPVTAFLLVGDLDLRVVPVAVVLGVIVHIAGDMATVGGCPLGWPWSLTARGPRKFRTNSPIERGPVTWACLVILAVTVLWNSGIAQAVTRHG
ncbi:metal-dependent hydrolase [Actinomadura litoris]|uniref:metal-dependent hydrolase n=1 Tax=Actinomadura litoris TaxID=2678616 RepID=UPI001FA7D198|nr:metal-dependent hydrolase [Actinomadura litoris]